MLDQLALFQFFSLVYQLAFELAGGGYFLSADKRTFRKGRYHGSAQGEGSNALGAADEQYSRSGDGGGEQRTDFQLRPKGVGIYYLHAFLS